MALHWIPSSDKSMGRCDRRCLMKNNKFQQLIVAKWWGISPWNQFHIKIWHCTAYGDFLDLYVGHNLIWILKTKVNFRFENLWGWNYNWAWRIYLDFFVWWLFMQNCDYRASKVPFLGQITKTFSDDGTSLLCSNS